jgi:hypothetical protein
MPESAAWGGTAPAQQPKAQKKTSAASGKPFQQHLQSRMQYLEMPEGNDSDIEEQY